MTTAATAMLMACGILGAAEEAKLSQPAKPEAILASKPVTAAEMTKISEAFGNFIGRNLKTPGIQFDLESIIKGIREGSAGKPSPMSDEEYEQAMITLQQNAFAAVSEKNLKEAQDYLAKNKENGKVSELVPGKLQYEIVTEGQGQTVAPHATVQINYVGKFLDGSTFGSSKDAGGPVTLSLDQTIPGFSQGLLGMKEGEKRRLYVHPDLGYGAAGHLPPNSLLIFEVDLVKANVPKEAAELDEFADYDEDDDDSDDDDNEDASSLLKPNSKSAAK